MPGIFINYRVGDGDGYAVVLKNRMSAEFHRDLIFFASKSIQPSSDYTIGLVDGVRQSDVVLAVIGPHWLDAKNGRRRLDDEGDWVRRELLEAIKWDIPIVPVLVSGTKMPAEEDLPKDLAVLAKTQYRRLDYREDESHLAELVQKVHELAEDLADAAAERRREDEAPLLPAPKSEQKLQTLPERLRKAAKSLAQMVETDLEAELRQSRFDTPGPIVTWSITDGSAKHKPVSEIAEGYLDLAGRRMILLGDAGAGKTTAAMLLALGVLRKKLEHKVGVPVFLPLSSWDVRREHLLAWMARQLKESYPRLAVHGRKAALDLVLNGRVLPVLDGLDEIHDNVRARAIAEINSAWPSYRPFVLTCRASDEHRVLGESEIGRSATIARLSPVAPDNASRFLRDVLPRHRLHLWEDVFARMKNDPAGPLATAFSSPLTLWLVRRSYADGPEEPARLLYFTDHQDIRDHLLDGLLPAVFAERPLDPGDRRRIGDWGVAKATDWLTVLARWLIRMDTTDLKWWELYRMVSHRAFAVLNAVAATVLSAPLLAWHWDGLDPITRLIWAGAGGLILGAGIAVVVPKGGNPLPVRLGFRNRVKPKDLAAALAITLGVGAVGGLTTHLLSDDAASSPAPTMVAGAVFALPLGTLLAIVGSLLLAVSDDAPPEPMSPRVTLRNDRAAAFTAAGIFTAGIGLPLTVLAPEGPSVLPLFLVLALVILMFHAWGRYRIIATALVLSRQLPWRLGRFLEDAYALGVLRKLGPAYQFRHRELRDRLAAQESEIVRSRAAPLEHGGDRPLPG